MTMPTVAVVTTNLDAGTDSPASVRTDLLDAVQKLNQIMAHISAFAGTLLDDASAPAARATLGSTTVGDAVFVAATAAAARTALVAAASGANSDITSLTALAAGGLPDNSVTTPDIAAGAVTPAKLSQPYTAGTAVATTSGTGFTFTGIPAWARKITIMFSGVLRTGTSLQVLRLGDSGGVETTGYKGSGIQLIDAASVNGALETSGFQIRNALAANDLNGCITLSHIGSNTWAVQGALSSSVAAYAYLVTGSKTLSAALDRINFTTVGGADTFTAGTINIDYE